MSRPSIGDLIKLGDKFEDYVRLDGAFAEILIEGQWVQFIRNYDLSSWANIQEIVRNGWASQYFNIGDQIASTFDGSPMLWDVIGINHDIPTDTNYTNSMTLQAHDVLERRQWHSSNNNRYIYSTGRAYLNNTTSSGFIGKIDPALAAVIGAVDKQVTKTTSQGGQDLFSDKVFHLSPVEVGFTTEGVTTGENVYAFYQGSTSADRQKVDGPSNLCWWWLRSPYTSDPTQVRHIEQTGDLGRDYASGSSYGFAPALVIV